jgi:formate hydrogenlyase subunit 6/NADH:ubiquinone oxidoreductase subunit I
MVRAGKRCWASTWKRPKACGTLPVTTSGPKYSLPTKAKPNRRRAVQFLRRHLFRRFIGRGTDELMRPVSASWAQPVPLTAIRFAAPLSTAGRELLQILFNTPQETPTPLPVHAALLAAQVGIRPGCTACEACARACPTGALQIREGATAWQLGFEFTRCVGCGVCVEACQPHVLYFKDEMKALAKAPEPVTLHALGKQRCTRCDRFFISPAPANLPDLQGMTQILLRCSDSHLKETSMEWEFTPQQVVKGRNRLWSGRVPA